MKKIVVIGVLPTQIAICAYGWACLITWSEILLAENPMNLYDVAKTLMLK